MLYKSSVGNIFLTADEGGLTGLYFNGQKFIKNDSGNFDDAIKWLDIYFSGGIPDFTPKLNLHGTDFQIKVWKILLKIQYGKVKTYGEIAKIISPKMSAQAVGNALKNNPVPIIIPCHRVIGKNKNLTGYSGGVDKKLWLLKHEGA